MSLPFKRGTELKKVLPCVLHLELMAEWPDVWKKAQLFGNVAQNVAKLQNLQLKVENSCIKRLLNVKIRTTNHVCKMII